MFGYGCLPGIVALVIWAIATSAATYRALTRPGENQRSTWAGTNGLLGFRRPERGSVNLPSSARPVPTEGIGIELVRDWAPQTAPKGHIVLVHGIAEHSGRYERTGSLLSDSGFFVRSFDLIGFGGTGGERADIDDWSRYHDQIQGHMVWSREQGGPLVLMGHSMGGNLAMGYALTGHPAPDLLVLTAPAMGGGAGWQRALAGVGSKVAPTVAIANSLKGEQLSRDPAVGEAYFSDPLVYQKTTLRLGAALFESMDQLNESFRDLAIPTLVLQGGADIIVPPQ